MFKRRPRLNECEYCGRKFVDEYGSGYYDHKVDCAKLYQAKLDKEWEEGR